MLSQHGSLEIDPSIQSSLANRQFAEILSQSTNGLSLYLVYTTYVPTSNVNNRFMMMKG